MKRRLTLLSIGSAFLLLALGSSPAADVTNGLVLHYSFDADSGSNVLDQTDNHLDGTGYSLEYEQSGVLDQAARMESGHYVASPSNALLNLGPLDSKSFSVWWKADSLLPQGMTLFSKRIVESNNKGLSFSIEFGAQYFLCLQINHWVKFRPSSMSTGTWNHVVLTKTGSTWNVYHNGQALSLNSSMGWPHAVDTQVDVPLWLGLDQVVSSPFNGLVDDFRVYSRVLSSSEVSSLYELGRASLSEVNLTVAGVPAAYGTPSPYVYGTSRVKSPSILTNTVETPVSAGTGVRRVCMGWTGTGSVPLIGTTNIVSFTLTNNSTLTWQWLTEYWLQTGVTGSGTVNVASGWLTNGATVSVTATPADGYQFAGWSGDVPGGMETNNPLSVSMSSARSLMAGFAPPAKPADGLLLHYTFDADNGSNVLDQTDSHLDGLGYGTTYSAEGVLGQATILKDGAYVASPTNVLLNLGTLDSKSFSMWWKADTLAPHGINLFSKRMVESNNKGLSFSIEFGSQYFMCVQIDHWVKFRPSSLSTGSWNHVVLTKTGSVWRVYHNGQELPIQSSMGWPFAADTQVNVPLWLGLDPVVGTPFNGRLDDFRVYGHVLTSNEVSELYDVGRSSLSELDFTVAGVPGIYGTPTPHTYGASLVKAPCVITNTVATPVSAGAGVRRACTGWTGTGSVPFSGTTNTVSFTLTNNSTLTWRWLTEYQLETSVSGSGTVNVAGGWHTNGATLSITATPENGFRFLGWSGNVPGGMETNNPLSVTMDTARSLQAGFIPEIASLDGLLLHYTFDADNGSNVMDETDNHLDGMGYGTTYSAGGVLGQATILKDGAYVASPANALLNLSPMDSKSISLWWKTDTLAPQGLNLFSKRMVESNNKGLSFSIEFGSQYFMCLQIDHWVKFQPPSISTGSWNHVVLTKTGSTWRVYHNGNELPIHSKMGWPFEANTQVNVPLWLGLDPVVSTPFAGQMDDFRVYGHALASNEVSDLYEEGRAALSESEFTVAGAPFNYGTPTPHAYGTSSIKVPCVLTNTVETPVNAGTGIRRACSGWTGTGSVTESGTSNSVSFTLTNNSTLTWQWLTEYRLDTSISGSGTVDVAGGWFTNGAPAIVTAFPDAGYRFLGWNGDVPAGSEKNNPLTLSMNAPRHVEAVFIPEFLSADGLLLHYTFDADNGSNVVDQTDNHLDGTGYAINYRPDGVMEQAAELGDGKYIAGPTSELLNLGPLDSKSFSLWWKADTLAPQGLNLFSKRIVESNNKGLSFSIEFGSQYFVCVQIDHWVKFRPSSLSTGMWNHVAVTKNGSSWRVYHNGQELPAHSSMGWPYAVDTQVDVPLWLGLDPVVSTPFDGQMDDFRVYGRALTSNEVSELYDEGVEKLANTNEVTVLTDVASISVPEGGVTDFQVKLSAKPTGSRVVAVECLTDDPDMTIVSGSSLTFTTNTWDIYQTVTVAAAEDDANNLAGSASIICSGDGVANATVTATENDDDYTLEVASPYGLVVKSPNQALYDNGTEVELTATAGPSYCFREWTGDCASTNLITSLVMNGNKLVTACYWPVMPEILPPSAISKKSFTARWKWVEGGAPEAQLSVVLDTEGFHQAVPGYARRYVINSPECLVTNLVNGKDYWYRVRRIMPDGSTGPWSEQVKARTGSAMPVFKNLLSDVPVSKGITQRFEIPELVSGNGLLKVKSSNPNAIKVELNSSALTLQYLWKDAGSSARLTLTLTHPDTGYQAAYEATVTRSAGRVAVVGNGPLVNNGANYKQDVTLENQTGETIYGIRVRVAGLDQADWLINKTGKDPVNMAPIREIPCVLPAGDQLTVRLVFTANYKKQSKTRPVAYGAWAIMPPVNGFAPVNEEMTITRQELYDGLWLLELPADRNRLYEVFYSDDDGANWALAAPRIRATANYLLWLDIDETAPADRLYRVLDAGL